MFNSSGWQQLCLVAIVQLEAAPPSDNSLVWQQSCVVAIAIAQLAVIPLNSDGFCGSNPA